MGFRDLGLLRGPNLWWERLGLQSGRPGVRVSSIGPLGSSYVLVGGYNLLPVGGLATHAYHLIRF